MNLPNHESARRRIQFRLATMFVISTMFCVAFAILGSGGTLSAKLALAGAFVLSSALFLVVASYFPSAKPVRVVIQALLGIIGAAMGWPIAFWLWPRASELRANTSMTPMIFFLLGAVVGGILAVVVLRNFWRLHHRIDIPTRFGERAHELSLYLAIGATLLAVVVLARGPCYGVARVISVGMAGLSNCSSLLGLRLAMETLGDPIRVTGSGAMLVLWNGLVVAFWILAGIGTYLSW